MTIEKPILFSAEMYRKIVANEKTMTRRVCSNIEGDWFVLCRHKNSKVCAKIKNDTIVWTPYAGAEEQPMPMDRIIASAHHPVGSLIWVKEPLSKTLDGTIVYGNDETLYTEFCALAADDIPVRWKWKRDNLPAMFMPKKYARLWLKVTAVRVERLQDISKKDVWAEGISQEDYETWVEDCSNIGGVVCESPIAWFQRLWDSINGKKYPWESNPWVWVYTFESVDK